MNILIKSRDFWQIYAWQALAFGLIGAGQLEDGKDSGFYLLTFSGVLIITSICSLSFGKKETTNRKYCHLIALVSAIIILIHMYM